MNEPLTPEELEKFIHRELRALPPRQARAGFESRLQAAVEARAAVRALTPAQLEKFIHHELRALPPRQAPRSLQSRVLAAVEHQSVVAWYHKSWAHWPAAVRAAFLGFATALSGIAIAAFYFMSQGAEANTLAAAAGERFAGVAALFHVFRWMMNYASETIANIPPLWLYGSLAVIAGLYATFFGLGAAAYRALYRNQ
jgi:hypothetical protein